MLRESKRHHPLAWAAYLGASWTWCIGMFLPVLLIRDYGPWAWVIFAIPNCFGAAAMGWVMRSSEQSERYTQNHRFTCTMFSAVTIAFQIFAVFWLVTRLAGNFGLLAVLVVAGAAFVGWIRESIVLLAAGVVLGISGLIAFWMAARGNLIIPANVGVLHPTAIDYLGLTAVCALGFFTCPYLDLTFHSARQHTTDLGAKLAFGLGFCVFFMAMIVFTLCYALPFFRYDGVIAILLGAHLMMQMAFTVYVHSIALRTFAPSRPSPVLALAVAAGLLAAVLSGAWQAEPFQYRGLIAGELIYRGFMTFYGLIFPTYVLLAIGRRGVSWILWVVIVLIASRFYWIAFVEREMKYATFGVAIVVCGALLSRLIRSPASASPSGQSPSPVE